MIEEKNRSEDLLRQSGWNVSETRFFPQHAETVAFVSWYGEEDQQYLRYMLCIGRNVVGGILVYPLGVAIGGTEQPFTMQEFGSPSGLIAERSVLPFAYETNGYVVRFSNYLDPIPRGRPVFSFHRPETLAQWKMVQLSVGPGSYAGTTLRSCLKQLLSMPFTQEEAKHWEILSRLEQSFSRSRRRMLVACEDREDARNLLIHWLDRLMRCGGAHRVLVCLNHRSDVPGFVNVCSSADRVWKEHSGEQSHLFNVQRGASRVTLTTVPEFFQDLSGVSFTPGMREMPSISYRVAFPPETFDLIVAFYLPEDHLYQLDSLLRYFDAIALGFTTQIEPVVRAVFEHQVIS